MKCRECLLSTPMSLIIALVLTGLPLFGATNTSHDAYSLYNTQVRIFHSDRVRIDYELYVSLPRDYETKSDSYPVIMILDADYCFAMTYGIVRLLVDHDELAPAILVGIAYPGVAKQKQGPIYKLSRTRDYTPSHVENDGYGYGEQYQKFSGGGDHFLDFVTQELAPYLEREFRVRPKDRTIIGYSFGGLLASYALLTRPDLFQRYLIVSPSLWWDGHLLLRLEEEKAPIRKDISARAFFSVGELEDKDQMPMVKDLKDFVNKLNSRRYPGLHTNVWIATDESHHSVFPGAVMRGIKWIFDARPANTPLTEHK